MQKKSVCIIGLGYIGLPTAALLASNGYEVIGVDVNQQVVDTINQGRTHILEPDLDAYVRSAVANGKLKAFTRPQVADIYIICVPTPFHKSAGIPQPNIDYVLAAADSIKGLVKADDLIILESTSPVGTTEKLSHVFMNSENELDKLNIAYCPERVLPGKIMVELVENDRIVGGLTDRATKSVSDFYRTFVRGAVLETNAPTAEMCKLAENSYRDVNIAFANELSLLSANAGVDVWRLIELANRHPRVNILQPGTGVGGHCIAVDPWFIVARDPENAKLIRTAREVNDYKTDWVINQIKEALNKVEDELSRKAKLVCLGLSFKPDIDDLRESPAIHVALSLQMQGYRVLAVEPNISSHDLLELADLDDALISADVIAVLVRHKEFVQLEKTGSLKNRYVLDFCGLNL
ncbi:UDP-N-acetyl-D-mannosamine dehydrogenase [Polynucleobacter sp. HIN7]|uniref:UDP-N-acetyl-D-mannosamine dehydrogenase n=1 Tax=Polynucleobacter sp. HIN7 TaxID=3047866 RepID=UPI0025730774|nr:UDP-N-acetyl-D-mannosamine dehydrogenase [Polynucleobacter sp. HIN7]BEI36606.1 UDP-N-acetyl-D-mannosamine dehydrogenase [Polynucleobacter sp. HIN7]